VARLLPPPGGVTPFDHRPELWAAFNRYYGTLWSQGVVDQPTKEVGRLRNARKTGCGICKNLRFVGARDAGLSEEHVSSIDDEFATSDLPDRWKLTIRYADALIVDPKGIDAELRAALLDEFDSVELVELTATITTAIAFSKAAVAFGAPPDMPVLEVPTPTVDGQVTSGGA
jgi:alkylhydroperoxidase family enzyme